MSLSCTQEQKLTCRDACCRAFAGIHFCDIESNCVATPTWIVILVPVLLGLAAIALLIIVMVRMRNRKVMDRYVFVKNQNSRLSRVDVGYQNQDKQETERHFQTNNRS